MEGDESADTDIIGQFGVGFYSAFMVADQITVITKKYGEDQAWKWQSTGVDGYTIEPCEKDAVGTDIIMHIKPDTEEEKDEYSQYLREYPLYRTGEEVFRLYPFPHPYAHAPSGAEGGQHPGEPRVRGEVRVGDAEQHGAPVAAEEGRRQARRSTTSSISSALRTASRR